MSIGTFKHESSQQIQLLFYNPSSLLNIECRHVCMQFPIDQDLFPHHPPQPPNSPSSQHRYSIPSISSSLFTRRSSRFRTSMLVWHLRSWAPRARFCFPLYDARVGISGFVFFHRFHCCVAEDTHSVEVFVGFLKRVLVGVLGWVLDM